MMLQFAWAIAQKTKPKLTNSCAVMKPEEFTRTVNLLIASKKYFIGAAELLEAAADRMLCAGAANAIEHEKGTLQ